MQTAIECHKIRSLGYRYCTYATRSIYRSYIDHDLEVSRSIKRKRITAQDMSRSVTRRCSDTLSQDTRLCFTLPKIHRNYAICVPMYVHGTTLLLPCIYKSLEQVKHRYELVFVNPGWCIQGRCRIQFDLLQCR